MFQDVMPLCECVHSMVDKVFGNNAEVVMGKMVQNIHEDVLKVRKVHAWNSLSLIISLKCVSYNCWPAPISDCCSLN